MHFCNKRSTFEARDARVITAALAPHAASYPHNTE
jgi:hypothetical protein